MAGNIKEKKTLLENVHNLVFTGAPGTGKTYLAKQIAKQMIGLKLDEDLNKSEQFAFVQFHPSYDYTDFVEGLRPTPPDASGNIGFELKNGVFKEFGNRLSGLFRSLFLDNRWMRYGWNVCLLKGSG